MGETKRIGCARAVVRGTWTCTSARTTSQGIPVTWPSENVRRHLAALPESQRGHAEHFVAQHPDYPHGDTALVIDATIYAQFMAGER
jgi:hypothetical protein